MENAYFQGKLLTLKNESISVHLMTIKIVHLYVYLYIVTFFKDQKCWDIQIGLLMIKAENEKGYYDQTIYLIHKENKRSASA